MKWRVGRLVLMGAVGGVFCAVSACATMNEAGTQNSPQARAHTELAARYFEVGQVATAVQEAQTAVQSDADYIPAHTLLALMYAQLRQNALADQSFTTALRLSESQKVSATDLRNSYAWYLCQTNRMNEGLTQLSEVLHDPIYGSMDKALVNAAVCSARSGQLESAQAYVKAALDMHPQFAIALLYRAHIAVSNNDLKAARADAQQAKKLMGESPEILWLQTRIDVHSDPAAAKNGTTASKRLLEAFPTSVEAGWLRTEQWQWF